MEISVTLLKEVSDHSAPDLLGVGSMEKDFVRRQSKYIFFFFVFFNIFERYCSNMLLATYRTIQRASLIAVNIFDYTDPPVISLNNGVTQVMNITLSVYLGRLPCRLIDHSVVYVTGEVTFSSSCTPRRQNKRQNQLLLSFNSLWSIFSDRKNQGCSLSQRGELYKDPALLIMNTSAVSVALLTHQQGQQRQVLSPAHLLFDAATTTVMKDAFYLSKFYLKPFYCEYLH